MKGDVKYTKDGKKVVVLGKLNNEQWIVQEIYVSGDQEIPMGENFVERTLLDEPAETWEKRELKKREDRLLRVETEIEKLDKECRLKSLEAKAYRLTNQIIEKYQDINVEELDTFVSFITGQITHFVIKGYHGYEIVPFIEALKVTDSSGYGHTKLRGLRLISLFGCCEEGKRHGEENKKFSLNWDISRYTCEFGSAKVYPCKSYEEAVAMVEDFLSKKEEIGGDDIKTKKKHNLKNPTKEKIEKYYQKVIEGKQKDIKVAEERIEEKKKELSEYEKEVTK